MSTLKYAAFEATAIMFHELGAKLVLVAQLGLVVAIAARRGLGNHGTVDAEWPNI